MAIFGFESAANLIVLQRISNYFPGFFMNSAKYRFELSEMDSRRTHTHFRSTHYAPARRRAIPAASIIEKGIHIIYSRL